MIPTPIDLRRLEQAIETFGFDPRTIGGDNYIRFWFADKLDEHFDYDNQYEQDCFIGDLVVLLKEPEGWPKRDHEATKWPNWVTMVQHRNGTTSYIFQPLAKLAKQEE